MYGSSCGTVWFVHVCVCGCGCMCARAHLSKSDDGFLRVDSLLWCVLGLNMHVFRLTWQMLSHSPVWYVMLTLPPFVSFLLLLLLLLGTYCPPWTIDVFQPSHKYWAVLLQANHGWRLFLGCVFSLTAYMQISSSPLSWGEAPDQVKMQSTSNHLWLLSDILGQGATANVFRGRHKVGTALAVMLSAWDCLLASTLKSKEKGF